jgi:hypothetical protein
MQRRRVLAGLTAGFTLLAGCNGSTGNNSSGNNSTQSTNRSNTSAGDETTATTVATTMAETAQETATQTETQTQTQTATATATPTPTQTATSQPTAETTADGTAAMETATGSGSLDLSNRETYSSNSYPYTIEYPSDWQVDETDPTEVSFTASDTPSSLTVYLREGAPSSVTLEQATEQFLSGYQQSAGENEMTNETLDRREVTLSNDNRAIFLDLRLSSAESSVSIRQNAVLTLVGDTLYTAASTIPEMVYSSEVGQQVEDMLLSLTVSGDSESTVTV